MSPPPAIAALQADGEEVAVEGGEVHIPTSAIGRGSAVAALVNGARSPVGGKAEAGGEAEAEAELLEAVEAAAEANTGVGAKVEEEA